MSKLIKTRCIKCDKAIKREEDTLPYCTECEKELQKKISQRFTFPKRENK